MEPAFIGAEYTAWDPCTNINCEFFHPARYYRDGRVQINTGCKVCIHYPRYDFYIPKEAKNARRESE